VVGYKFFAFSSLDQAKPPFSRQKPLH